jgi:hypothetical protein
MKSGVRAGGSRSSPAAGTVLASLLVNLTTSAISGELPAYLIVFNSDLTKNVAEKLIIIVKPLILLLIVT